MEPHYHCMCLWMKWKNGQIVTVFLYSRASIYVVRMDKNYVLTVSIAHKCFINAHKIINIYRRTDQTVTLMSGRSHAGQTEAKQRKKKGQSFVTFIILIGFKSLHRRPSHRDTGVACRRCEHGHQFNYSSRCDKYQPQMAGMDARCLRVSVGRSFIRQ